jgi:CrcB protein
MLYVWIGVAGFAGAVARFWLGALIARRRPGPFPWSTFVINISGSLLLGLLTGLTTARGALPPSYKAVLGAGFLGAYTTFSTWNLETVRLLGTRSNRIATANLVGSTAAGLLAAALGLLIGVKL